MFDLPVQSPASPRQAGLPPHVATQVADPSLPFSLTVACHAPAALISAQARPIILDRSATLAEAMQVAVDHADDLASHGAPRMMAILDREDRLVLAGVVSDGCVAWCHPVSNAAEARAVVLEASQTRAKAMRAAEWQDFDMAQRLRHRSECLDARLVDPLWRVFAARALQIAA